MVFEKFTTYCQSMINLSQESQNIYNTSINTVTQERTTFFYSLQSDLIKLNLIYQKNQDFRLRLTVLSKINSVI